MPQGRRRPNINPAATTTASRTGMYTVPAGLAPLYRDRITAPPQGETNSVQAPGRDTHLPPEPAAFTVLDKTAYSDQSIWLNQMNNSPESNPWQTAMARYRRHFEEQPAPRPVEFRWPTQLTMESCFKYRAPVVGGEIIAAAAALLAYDTNGTRRAAFKELIGATEINVLEVGGGGPKGLEIKSENYTLYAIQGTNTPEQVAAYTTYPRDAFCTVSTSSGKPSIGLANDGEFRSRAQQPWNIRADPYYFGTYLKPFIDWSDSWIDIVEAEVRRRAGLGGGGVFLCGHSMGGAICEVIANWFSWVTSGWTRDLRPVGAATDSLAQAIPITFRGGWTFGHPKVCVWNYPWMWPKKNSEGIISPVYCSDADTNYKVGVRDTDQSWKLKAYNWATDPIGYFPIYSPNWPYAFLGGHRSRFNYGSNTRQAQAHEMVRLDADLRGTAIIDTIAEIRTGLQLSHAMRRYYERIVRATLRNYRDGGNSVVAPLNTLVWDIENGDSLLVPV